MHDLSAAEARAMALAAQGLVDPPPPGGASLDDLRRAIGRVGLIQIDSVNAVVRSHYLPPFSRLGPYDRGLLDDLAYARRELFETWGHAASFAPVDAHPLLRWRMRRRLRRRRDAGGTDHLGRWAAEHAAYVRKVLREVRERGPLGASDLEDPRARRGAWWSWGDGKAALEWLFATGEVAVAGRRNFARLYDLTERVLPRAVLDAPTPRRTDAQRELIVRAARSLGVGTECDLADYFRIDRREARPRLRELVEDGRLVPVRVEGWREPAFAAADAACPRRVSARALLSPFDSLVWERARTERIFGFRYRIEIYTPEPKRRYGYYVLPFLFGDRLAARVDLRSDRAAGELRVPAVHLEPGADAEEVRPALDAELARLASWLGLRPPRGGASPRLTGAGRRAARSRS